MTKLQKTESIFLGDWRITEMELWDPEQLDLAEPAHIRFDEGRSGEFCFIAVRGFLDWEFGERGNKQAIEFSWVGDDDGMPSSGRGWVVIESDKQLSGRIYFHDGDHSGLKATKTNKKPKKKKPKIGSLITKDGIKRFEF